MSTAAMAPSEKRDIRAAWILFALALGFSAWGTSVGWKNDRLAGNEFRQTQTALTAFFIQRDHDFSLAYPTPVLGKPWSIPFEFPLYQWVVVVVSNVTGMPLTQAARAVSWACFYLTLPAVWLLLRRAGVTAAARPVMVGLVLICPLYIFYARAFLIETMALMFGLWFVCAVVAAVERHSVKWLVMANLAGMGAGLVKVTTLIVYLIPLAGWAMVRLWRARPALAQPPGSWRPFTSTAGWLLAVVAVPVGAAEWWIKFSDRVKTQSPTGVEFLSWKLTSYSFGTWPDHVSPDVWMAHWRTQNEDIVPWYGLMAALLLAICCARRWWKWMAGCVALYLFAQLLFPILYAWHEYYFVANGVLLAAAVGFALAGLLESTWPRWAVWSLVVGFFAMQAACYLRGLYPGQRLAATATDGVTDLVRELTGRDDVMIIAGEDWSSVRPFYSQRRAFMIRRNVDRNWSYLESAFRALEGERVSVLLLRGAVRGNSDLRNLVKRYFGIETEPVAFWEDTNIYVSPRLRPKWEERLRDVGHRGVGLVAPPAAKEIQSRPKATEVASLTPEAQEVFSRMSPRPVRYYSQFGLGISQVEDRQFLNAHPDTSLWFSVPAGSRHLTAEYCIVPGAYDVQPDGYVSDGVEFSVRLAGPDGSGRTVFSRWLNPHRNAGDRGVQLLALDLEVKRGEEIVVETGPGPANNYFRDWASWGAVSIK